jgi:hypothetical protein
LPVDTRKTPHLSLVNSSAASVRQTTEDRLHLPPSRRLDRFIATAAARGLSPSDAVRLALERALVLVDACEAFPLDVESARLALRRAAAATQPLRQLSNAQSSYVRALGVGRPQRVESHSDGLIVALPDRLITRARDTLTELALHEGAVAEMISWEIAATLEGRTMCEWALNVLAVARRTA